MAIDREVWVAVDSNDAAFTENTAALTMPSITFTSGTPNTATIKVNNGATARNAYSFRATALSHAVNRGTVTEEAIDVASFAGAAGGKFSASGSLEGAFRADPATKALITGITGSEGTDVIGWSDELYTQGYTLKAVPKTLALAVFDEQAKDGAGRCVIYTGVGITSMEISLNVNEYAKVKYQWIARRGSVITTSLNNLNTSYAQYPMAVFYNAALLIGTTPIKAKGFTMTVDRKFDQEYFFIGSEFLQGLYLNGITAVNGTLTLGSGEWDMLNFAIAGSTSAQTLDVGKTEFSSVAANALQNGIQTGLLSVIMHSPSATAVVSPAIPARTARISVKSIITEMNANATGRNMWERTVNWQASLDTDTDFAIAFGEPRTTE